uniref:Sushi domain-containing protein n=1 Tax=Mesocestoides corti TaxID=53468 RepID=A0A5K3EK34_MESCO
EGSCGPRLNPDSFFNPQPSRSDDPSEQASTIFLVLISWTETGGCCIWGKIDSLKWTRKAVLCCPLGQSTEKA